MHGFVCSEGLSEPHREAMEQIVQWVGAGNWLNCDA
jgi:hypothetical protein